MDSFNSKSIDELNKLISEQIAARDMKETQTGGGDSSSGKIENPSSSILDTAMVEEDDMFSADEDWCPSGQDLVVYKPVVQGSAEEESAEEEPMEEEPVEEEPMEEEDELPQEVGSRRPSEPIEEEPPSEGVEQMFQDESSDQRVMEVLSQLKEMENIIPVKKRSLAESSEGQKEVSQAESLDEEKETLTSRKKRKFTPAKGKNLPVRWSSRKVSAVKEEPKPETRTPVIQKARTRNPSAVMGKSREVMDELSVSAEFLKENELKEVFELLKFQGWLELLSEDEPVDKDLVADFFDKVSKVEMGPVVCLSFEFRGQQLMVTSRDLAIELGMKHEGFDLYTKKFWPEHITETEKEEMEKRVCNYSDQNVNELSTNDMHVTAKVLHRLLVHSLLPRKSKTASAQIQDILVLDQILRKKKINWAKLILHHIEYISEFKEVGYAKLVKKILKLSCVYEPDLEVSVQRPLTTNSIHRWGFEFVGQVGWVKKDHKTPAEEKVPSKVSEGSDLVQIKESLARLEKSFNDQRKEISELKAMIREGFKGKKKA